MFAKISKMSLKLADYINLPGEHAVLLPGLTGDLEAIIAIPDLAQCKYFAILGHPHSLKGGNMHNKVVTTMASAFKILGIPTIRLNFRGVGKSRGVYDNGVGESEDLIHLSKLVAELVNKENERLKFILAGFSFGAYVTYRAAVSIKNSLLISIAPPVETFDFTEFIFPAERWLIVQGDQDEIVSSDTVFNFAQARTIPTLRFNETGHFFHGKLVELKEKLIQYLEASGCLTAL